MILPAEAGWRMGLTLDPAGLGWEIGYDRLDLSFGLRLLQRRKGGFGATVEVRGRF